MTLRNITPAQLSEKLQQVLLGRKEVCDQIVIALIAGGHILLEDVPGTGKTTVAKGLATLLHASFERIQCTPDLLPQDMTGATLYDRQDGRLVFQKGPLFAHVVLVDELNRATPRSQSALLEAMAERQITADGKTHPLPAPYFVMATQNPVEQEGTFPLPEAQLDRFLMRLRIGYASKEVEASLLLGYQIPPLEYQTDKEIVLQWQDDVKKVRLDEDLAYYIVELADKSRKHPDIALGVSPRASLAMAQAARAKALLMGRDYVVPDDIISLLDVVWSHRLLLTGDAELKEQSTHAVLAQIRQNTPTPVEVP